MKGLSPRLRGNHGRAAGAHQGGGLSPRLRGNPPGMEGLGTLEGSIPAPTGKPCHRMGMTLRTRLYPRAYGETIGSRRRSASIRGLSPRLRGNLGYGVQRAKGQGSIPAPTGKPVARVLKIDRTVVYPRAYGETCDWVEIHVPEPGLSPRLRGNHEVCYCPHCDMGSIPAPTGKPSCAKPCCICCGVYPRAYGETKAISKPWARM